MQTNRSAVQEIPSHPAASSAPAVPPTDQATPQAATTVLQDDTVVMTRQVRATAFVTFTTTAAAAGAFAVGVSAVGAVLTALQAATFAVAVRTPSKHPYRHLARKVARWFPLGEQEHPLPQRFAAQVGMLFMIAALGASSISAQLAAIFAGACSVAAALNAFANTCIACAVYPRVQTIKATVGRHVRR